MLNDVVTDIKNTDITNKNPDETSKVLVTLENSLIKLLQEADNPNHKLSLILFNHFNKNRKNKYKFS